MSRRLWTFSIAIVLAVTLGTAAGMRASSDDAPVADAAMKGDKESVQKLLKQAADVNAAQGDGSTALHWAAENGDASMAQILIFAGANVGATTRIGGYTPLLLAARRGAAPVVDVLLKAGANVREKDTNGLTPLMMAAQSGNVESVHLLLAHGADVNAKEPEHGQTSVIFAAAFNRGDVVRELAKNGANLDAATEVQEPPQRPRGQGQGQGQVQGQAQQGQRGQRGQRNGGGGQAAQVAGGQPPEEAPGNKSPRGGLTPLMYAARDGRLDAIEALAESGANLNARSADKSTALLIATINGHLDAAKYLAERGADVNLPSMDDATPLFGVFHVQWSRESERPQPSIKREQTSYLDLASLLLDRGADPNARLTRTLWYTSFGQAYESASDIGTTAFWKCAEVGDLDGMKLLLSRGADPNVANKDGVNALLIASGAGTHGNDDIMAPPGRLATVRFLVEVLHFDVNASDNGASFRGEFQAAAAGNAAQGQQANPFTGPAASGYTALHNAASRGDNAMILYLVSKGARVNAVSKSGVTVIDMANGPRQRVQPYASTIALLEMLGATNSHKCISC